MSPNLEITPGRKGRNVPIDRSFGSPIVTKDGVTVAEEIELRDSFENLGEQTVKEEVVAAKTPKVAGDATTKGTVPMQAIYREGGKLIAKDDPREIKRSIDKAVAKVVQDLAKMYRPTKQPKGIAQMATRATLGDVVVAAFDEAARHSTSEAAIADLATRTANALIRRTLPAVWWSRRLEREGAAWENEGGAFAAHERA